MEREAAPGPTAGQDVPEAGLRSTRWHLAARPGDGGTRYAVYVDGRLITAGHATADDALAAAARLLSVTQAAAPPPGSPP